MSIVIQQSDISEAAASKLCSKCCTVKPFTDFYRQKYAHKDVAYTYPTAECKKCIIVRQTARAKNRTTEQRQKRRLISRKSHQKLKNGVKSKFLQYKRGASVRNLIFDLTFDQFCILWKQPCIYCKAEIETIGLDRFDSKQGYTLTNCVPCCFPCNQMKNNITVKMCKRILEIAESRKQCL